MVVGLHAVMNDGITLPGAKANGLSVLRRLMKQNIYQSAKLLPRASDTDFPDGDIDGAIALDASIARLSGGGTDAEKLAAAAAAVECMSDARFEAAMQEFASAITSMAEFYEKNNMNMPLLAQQSAGLLLNNTMLAMLSTANDVGGFLSKRHTVLDTCVAEHADAQKR